jgi:hypothetical protein
LRHVHAPRGDGRHTGLHVGAEVRPMVCSENDLTIVARCYHVHDWPRNAAVIERGSFPSSGS